MGYPGIGSCGWVPPEEQIRQIRGAIREFGFTNPPLIDETDMIIAGHGRVAAATREGLEEIPCITIANLSEAQRRALVIADNKLALNAEWNEDLLASELAALSNLDFDMNAVGFSDSELAALATLDEKNGGLTPDDEAPALEDKPVCLFGDCWELGAHRLVCGDATNEDHVKLLMGEERADLIITDPPYGVKIGKQKPGMPKRKNSMGKSWDYIAGDSMDGDDVANLVRAALLISKNHCKRGSAAYVFCNWKTYKNFIYALESTGTGVNSCIVWDKGAIGLGHSHYRPRHEFLLYSEGQWYGDKTHADVWQFSRGDASSNKHPTQKPVELIEKALTNSSKAGDLIFDCFAGSGTLVIACAKTDRSARVLELEPRYADVIIRRWQDWSGEKAVHAETGHEFGKPRPAKGKAKAKPKAAAKAKPKTAAKAKPKTAARR